MAPLPDAVDDLEPFVPLCDEARDLFGGVLQIAIHLDEPFPACVEIERLNGRFLAVVSREADYAHAALARGYRS